MKKTNLFRSMRRFFLFALTGILAFVCGQANQKMIKELYPYRSADTAYLSEAAERNRGVTTDGSGWICSGGSKLVKLDFDYETVLALNKDAAPGLATQIGGLSYADGYVFAAIEDASDPIVAVYDAETLEYKTSIVLPGMERPIAWVACDAQAGVLVTAAGGSAQTLNVFDLNTYMLKKTISLSMSPDAVRGGEFFEDKLYLATNDEARSVYRVNLLDGETELYFERFESAAKRGGVGGDITALRMDDGTVFHAVSTGALGIDVSLCHYEPTIEANPNVRYLQKFVIDPLNSGACTIRTDMTADGDIHPATIYKSGENSCYEMSVSSILSMDPSLSMYDPIFGSIPFGAKIRFIVKASSENPKMYLDLPAGYIDIEELLELDDADFTAEDFRQIVEEYASGTDDIFRELSTLQYIETVPDGYASIRESYLSVDGTTVYHFFFTSQGLSSILIVDEETGEVLNHTAINIVSGIADDSVFTPRGAKLDTDTLKRLLAIISD